jgi:acyl phosphate:glycerol-3-phosphate acyltransferase
MAWRYLVAGVVAYVLGSISPGIFWGWVMRRIDVRLHGSGRTGGTNVWRTAGFTAALLTAIFDALKGAAGVRLAQLLGLPVWMWALTGTLAVAGHNFSLFLHFRGGAGTATSVGAAAVLWAPSLAVLILSGVVAGLLVGHASVASITVALLLPVLFLVRGEVVTALAFGLPVTLLTLWALRPNIGRLVRGEERFLPIYEDRPPLIRLSRHPAATAPPTEGV